jgi:hypothetical protein
MKVITLSAPPACNVGRMKVTFILLLAIQVNENSSSIFGLNFRKQNYAKTIKELDIKGVQARISDKHY